MNETTNPFFVALLFILRCLVPVAILFGISYILRKLGLVAQTPEPPADYEGNDDTSTGKNNKNNKKES